ncbi:MAG TPA: heme-binding protein [Streptosporangiaceae bacterium]
MGDAADVSAELSRRLMAAAVDEATAMSVRATIVIVDESGVVKELSRMDGAPPGRPR